MVAIAKRTPPVLYLTEAPGAVRVVTENLKKCRMTERAAVHQRTWDAFLAASKTRYSLIFLDPPYRSGLCLAAMEALCGGHLANHAIVVCETAPEETLPEQVGPLVLSKTTKYGNTRVFLYRTVGLGEGK